MKPNALLFKLPGALLEPVVQNRPLGRRPKNIVPMWRERLERGPLLRVARLNAQLDFVRQARRESFAEFHRDSKALCELEKRIAASYAVYDDLARRDKALCAELADLGAPALPYRDVLDAADEPKGGAA